MCQLIFRFGMYFIAGATALIGASILGVGSAKAADVEEYMSAVFDLLGTSLDSELYLSSIYIMIAAGVLLLGAAFFGCCGAWRSKTCCLTIFNIFTFVIIALVITSGVLATIYKNSWDSDVASDEMFEAIEDPNYNDEWDSMQSNLQCCGVNGTSDWDQEETTAMPSPFLGHTVPASCCVNYNTGSFNESACHIEHDYYPEGCLYVVEDQVYSDADVVMGVCFSLAILNAIGIFLACCIKNKLEDSNPV